MLLLQTTQCHARKEGFLWVTKISDNLFSGSVLGPPHMRCVLHVWIQVSETFKEMWNYDNINQSKNKNKNFHFSQTIKYF